MGGGSSKAEADSRKQMIEQVKSVRRMSAADAGAAAAAAAAVAMQPPEDGSMPIWFFNAGWEEAQAMAAAEEAALADADRVAANLAAFEATAGASNSAPVERRATDGAALAPEGSAAASKMRASALCGNFV